MLAAPLEVTTVSEGNGRELGGALAMVAEDADMMRGGGAGKFESERRSPGGAGEFGAVEEGEHSGGADAARCTNSRSASVWTLRNKEGLSTEPVGLVAPSSDPESRDLARWLRLPNQLRRKSWLCCCCCCCCC